ncbi:MAG: deoxyribonuclease IV [Dehalococcoidia bacterium]|uniref:deoxyribonuclease IV n=1 Tax=Candidatus Amarobacter glycogenicus TaxID=3140699 RepID=UPI0031349194|nr:deoxyribonuclease IV [Dehalococcoidia bacterium]
MRIGAHVSSAGGHHLVFERGRAIGAEAVQLFISAPQQWKLPACTGEQIAAFNAAREMHALPAFFHGVYLMNFGSPDEAMLERSMASLRSYMHFAGLMGVAGTIFHVGSHLGAGFSDTMARRIGGMLLDVLNDEPANPSLLILENNAGQGNCIGGHFGELGALIRAMDNHPRAAICIDTCHAFSMGYDLATEDGCQSAMAEFEQEIGFSRLAAVHANDTKQPIGTFRDRHENIGEGHIGLAGFRTLMAHPAFRDVPFLLEVPGFDGAGPDVKNVQRLKKLRRELAIDGPKLPRIPSTKKPK